MTHACCLDMIVDIGEQLLVVLCVFTTDQDV